MSSPPYLGQRLRNKARRELSQRLIMQHYYDRPRPPLPHPLQRRNPHHLHFLLFRSHNLTNPCPKSQLPSPRFHCHLSRLGARSWQPNCKRSPILPNLPFKRSLLQILPRHRQASRFLDRHPLHPHRRP